MNLENLTYVESRSGTVADRWDAHWIPYQINYDGVGHGQGYNARKVISEVYAQPDMGSIFHIKNQ